MGLGPLERAIMEALWEAPDPLVLRDLMPRLDLERPLAYTTVQTVADRLVRKGLVTRKPYGRAYRYAAVTSREDHVVGLMLEALADSPDRVPVLARFVETVAAEDARRVLDALAGRLGRPSSQPESG